MALRHLDELVWAKKSERTIFVSESNEHTGSTLDGIRAKERRLMPDEPPTSLPFRVVVNPLHQPLDRQSEVPDEISSPTPDMPNEAGATGEGWSLDDIEAAYQQALESLDELDVTVAEATTTAEWGEESDFTATGMPSENSEAILPESMTPERAGLAAFFLSTPQAAPPLAVAPRQVVEALLFVGGTILSSRKIADVIGGSTTSEDVLSWIDELNSQYDTQGRPYRIELTEGGHRMQLRTEFEKVRHRVYGVGPREVKLGQDVLEVLSFIAYTQPVSDVQLNDLGRAGTTSVVRQLLRRELVAMSRNAEGEPVYSTTPRFLEVFGLRSMHDLPLPSDLAFK